MDNTIKVLVVNNGIMARGGIEAYIMNALRNIDRKEVEIDVLVHGAEPGYYDSEIQALGANLHTVPRKADAPLKYISKLRSIMKTGQYPIVHSMADAMSCIILAVAKSAGVPVRIAHSHNTENCTNSKMKYAINEFNRKKLYKYATDRLACSEAAGQWLFGQSSFEVMPNGFEIDKFQFDPMKRTELRSRYGISSSEVVIGHVGRFDVQKNHSFLIQVMNRLKKEGCKSKLVLVGEGWLLPDIKDMVISNGLEDQIIFLGQQADVFNVYNMFDIFVLPSLFEGLPTVLLEAQANGLLCFTSDAVTREIDITENVKHLPLDLVCWKNALTLEASRCKRAEGAAMAIEAAGFGSKTSAIRLKDYYQSCMLRLDRG